MKMENDFYPGKKVRRKTDGRKGKIIYCAFRSSEVPVIWLDTCECKFVPKEELELCERS